MKYPTYLENHIKDVKDKFLSTITLCDTTKEEKLSIYYFGELMSIKGEQNPYITDKQDKPMLIIAKQEISGEEFVVYDGALHGYDNMFCNTYTDEQLQGRVLEKLQVPSQKLILELGYSIDYDSEKEDYEMDESGKVILVNGSTMSFEDVKRNGYDYLSLSYMDKKGNIIQCVDVELA